MDEIKSRFLNGDGATWINHAHDPETGVFQLDPYHLSQIIVRNVSDKKARYHIERWLKSQFESVYREVEKLRMNVVGL